ncbi:sensor histidine kinase [Actinorugispora endophytica]|uniref:histidine kinase n=1 Tax=Actinorugispora endophytica TaxID=1605990 RepID=A0A4R6UR10_9ACTN|nr:nitrate- and nitrite sensing domain-containing protein [Actinorugispora endophytica]TDQ48003.1 signal transduction histidine kinase [Actinorugispora endophytica]
MQAAKKRRDPSIRSRLRRIVLAPTSALIVLWLIVSGYLAYGAVLQYTVSRGTEQMLIPAALALVSVMDERSATIAHLEHPADEGTDGDLEAARADADERMTEVIGRFEGVLSLSPEPVQQRIIDLRNRFDEISDIRALVDSRQASRGDVQEYYNTLMQAGADLFDEQSRHLPNERTVGPALSATYVFRALDLLAQSDAQLSRAFSTGELTREDQNEFIRLTGAYQGMIEAVRDYLGPEETAALDDLRSSDEFGQLTQLTGRISDRTVGSEVDVLTGETTEVLTMPVTEEEWRAVYLPAKEAYTGIGADQARYATEIQNAVTARTVLTAVLGSLGVAVVSALALVVSTRSSKQVVARLHRLRDDTQELADHRLPDLIRRLGRNEPVDVESEVPGPGGSEDEIGQVRRSFNAAQRTAIEAAVQQARLREGVNRVFLNIAHRSQTLVHRQLRLLDRLEREQEDPDQLTDLFKLDHLATRARRNAENLLILGGESPGRTWHTPMPLIDVLRGAISESGDYTRVKRQRIARVSLHSAAVADVIHLVAELVDNATTFSPPHTKVHLRSEQVPNGVTIEIEDRGLGMREDEFAAANALLETPPEFDVMRLNEKMRLGLFVVSRLAQRHDIKVRLRASPYGGVQAIVLLPAGLIAGGTGSASDSEAPELPAPDETAPSLPFTRSADPRPLRASEDGRDRASNTGDRFPVPPPEIVGGDMLDQPAEPPAEAGPAAGKLSRLPQRVPGVNAFPGYEPEYEGTTPAEPPAAPAEPPAAPAEPPATPTEPAPPSGGRPPLPRRVPQVNLAPQLVEDSDGEPSPAGPAGDTVEDPERPMKLRRNLTAFQEGTRKGREDGRKRLNDTEKDS